MQTAEISRFAPTTSGRAHPGTLLAALLAWADARSRGARFILRMEDIDPSSVRDEWRVRLLEDLEWFGLEWDSLVWQSACRDSHETLMDALAATGRLYACNCSRTDIQRAGLPSAAGGWVYPGTCRHRSLGHDWRSCDANIRVNLEGIVVDLVDESGMDLGQKVAEVMGDPVLRRRDGTMTYQLAVVADDQASGVNRIVRGRDIASSTATQAALRMLAAWPLPVYRHHMLLLEPRGEKLAKFHGSVSVEALRHHYGPDALRGVLAQACGLLPPGDRVPALGMGDFLALFDWNRVGREDRVLAWDGLRLIPDWS